MEIKKMLKKEILIETEKIGRIEDYYVHPDFKKTFDDIKFEKLKPYPKKVNDNALKVLHMVALKSDRIFEREMNYKHSLSTREPRNEFKNFQQLFKEILFPADLIDIFNIKDINGKFKFKKISTTLIYSSDYEHPENSP